MLMHPLRLGVNIDHVATLRQVRRATYPDPLLAALIAEQSGADSVTQICRSGEPSQVSAGRRRRSTSARPRARSG